MSELSIGSYNPYDPPTVFPIQKTDLFLTLPQILSITISTALGLFGLILACTMKCRSNIFKRFPYNLFYVITMYHFINTLLYGISSGIFVVDVYINFGNVSTGMLSHCFL